MQVKIINSSFLFLFFYEWNHKEEKSLQHILLACYIMVFGSQALGKRREVKRKEKKRGEEKTLFGHKAGG